MVGKGVSFSTFPVPGLNAECSNSHSDSAEGPLEYTVMGMRGGAGNPLEGLLSTITGQKQDSKSRSKKKRSSGGPKLEKGLRIVKVKPDGRCLFRALAKGLTHKQGVHISGEKEEHAADELRMAVYDALCRSDERAKSFEEVEYSIEHFDGGKSKFCGKLHKPDFWGGEVEILVLSKMLHTPIYVYKSAEEAKMGGYGYIRIAAYGEEWERTDGKGGMGKPIKVLYGNGNHYDALL